MNAPPFVDICHAYEYGGVPVEGIVLVMDSVWSASIKEADTEGAEEPVNCDETVMVGVGDDAAVSGVEALSVT
jgi:hypothetical protein